MGKIIGIGNALVDILVRIDDEKRLESMGLAKGTMRLVDAAQHRQLRLLTAELSAEQSTGGSAGNTMLALAGLGNPAGFVGKVGRDALGRFYQDNCRAMGIDAHLLKSDLPTGVANTFITPDGERTFGTWLGAAAALTPADITPDLFEDVSTVHLEGYLVQNHELMEAICLTAMEQGVQLSLDLASHNVVTSHFSYFQHLVQDYMDIVFANEEEAAAFTGKQDPVEALRAMAAYKCLAVVKMGSRGAGACLGEEEAFVGARRVPVVDTTAAGDFFAGGFLHALERLASLQDCLRSGAWLAEHIIGTVGTKLGADEWKEIRKGLPRTLRTR